MQNINLNIKDLNKKSVFEWFSGFVDGEGHFSLTLKKDKKGCTFSFVIGLHVDDEGVLDFIVENLGGNIGNVKIYGNTTRLVISKASELEVIINILDNFPSFGLKSVKYLDFQDWSSILNIKAKGFQYLPKGQNLIDDILSQMNNNRLFSKNRLIIDRNLLLNNIADLFNEPSNFKLQDDGRILIVSQNKYYSVACFRRLGNHVKIRVENLNNEVLYTFDSIKDCLETLKISKSQFYSSLGKKGLIHVNGEPLIIKRVNNTNRSNITLNSIELDINLFSNMLNTLYKKYKYRLSMSTINALFFLCVEILFVCNLLLLLNKNEYITYNFSNNTCVLIPSINLNRKHLNYIISSRSYSTSALSVTDKNKVYPISPWFISGYTDAEGCFNIGIQKNSNGKYYVKPSFQIKVHSRDSFLLMNIKHYLGDIGNIYTSNTDSSFTVKSLDHLLKIIAHFNDYPLITKKKADFILFKEIIYKIVEGEHLSAKGLQEIVNIRASINLGLSPALKTNFPDTIPVIRPNIENVSAGYKIHPEWMSGFASGEGCFSVHLSKYGKGKLDGVSLSFRVSQHSRDELLLKSFISFFECGLFNYHDKNKKAGVFIVRKFSDILDKILPFFEKHPIIGVKKEDYEDWTKVIKLIESKDHLTENGIEKIRKIKLVMNTQR